MGEAAEPDGGAQLLDAGLEGVVAADRPQYRASERFWDRVLERFAGEWLSKAKWEQGGVSRDQARGFANYAMTKMVDELKAGAS